MVNFKKFNSFIKDLKPSDRIVLVHDTDGDGVSAAALMIKACQRLDLNCVGAVPFVRYKRMSVAERILSLEPTHVMVLDISAEQYEDFLAKMTDKKILIIDHHVIVDEPHGVLLLKPQTIGYEGDPGDYPTGKLVYDFMSQFVELSDVSWMAAVAVISDAATPHWQDFLNEIFMKFEFEENEDIFETIPGQVAKIIESARDVAPARTEEALDMIVNKSLKEILMSSLAELSKDIDAEVAKYVSDPELESYYESSLNFYFIEPKYMVKSIVVNKLSFAEPDKTFVVFVPVRDLITVSLRDQSRKVDCNALIRQVVKGLEGADGGGHVAAAGGKALFQDFEKIKQRIIELYPEFKN
tara:strand:- start:341 stop:1402 length:1062 start_codon:yes stop_codon:yes gene_type:complete